LLPPRTDPYLRVYAYGYYRMGSLFSFPVGLFHPYNMPVYPGAPSGQPYIHYPANPL